LASFEKAPNQSKKGWDERSGSQTLGVGEDTEVSLRPTRPEDEGLEIVIDEPSVCTVHERPPTGAPRTRRFVITALKEGSAMVYARVPRSAPDHRGDNVAYLLVVVKGPKRGVRLVFFPGERSVNYTSSRTVTLGMIYVVGGEGERFSAAGGPPLGYIDPTQGGHTVDPTPAGRYVLGPKEHVTTSTWIKSVIPWGAAIRINGSGEAEFKGDKGGWRLATGPNGEVTAAAIAFAQKSQTKDKKPTRDETIAKVRAIFIDPTTKALKLTTWELNDFGKWGWNLRAQPGRTPTAYYIHTTPADERADAAGRAVELQNSHGCVHVVPTQRDQMIAKGYLAEGVEFEVRPYNEVGPP
jgi:hypothetical protein